MNNWNNLVNTIKSIDDVENTLLNENKTAINTAAKTAVKAIPYAGVALSFHDAWNRWNAGDRSGAVLSVLTGAAYGVPVVGTGLGLGMDAYGAYRDYQSNSANTDASMVQTKENKVSEVEKITKLKNTLDSISKKSIHESKLISGLGGIILDAVPASVKATAIELGRTALNKVDDVARGASKSDIEVPAKVGTGARTPAQQASMDAASGKTTADVPAGGSTITRPGPDATPEQLAAYRVAKQRQAQAAADRTATPKPADAAGGSGGGNPPGGRPGATAEPVPATATGGAGGAGGGGASPPTVTPPASPPPGGGAGNIGGGGAVGRPADVASDVGTQSSSGGQIFRTDTGTVHKASQTNPNQQSSTGQSPAGGAVTTPATTTVATKPTVPATGGTTGGPLANPATTTVATKPTPTTSTTGNTGASSGAAGAGGTSRPAGPAGTGGTGTGGTAGTPSTATGDALRNTAAAVGGATVAAGLTRDSTRTATTPDDREQYERDIISRSNVSGYTPGGSDDPDRPDPNTTTTQVPPRDQVTTVDAQAQPERLPAGSNLVPPSGSGFRLSGDIAPNVQAGRIDSVLPANFGAAPQGFRFSQEQERWLTMPTQDGRPGNPNRQDPYILNRMIKKVGGPIPPLSYFKDEDDRVIAKRLGFPEVPLGNDQTLNAGLNTQSVSLAQNQQQTQQTARAAPPVQQQASQQRQPSVQSTQPGSQSGQPFQFTQAQEKWLTMPTQDGRPGNPNRQDPYILRNMARKAGGPLPPVSYFKDPEDQALARRLGFPMNESNNELNRLKELIKKI